MSWVVQFTELNKQEQLAKLTEMRAATAAGPLKKFRLVSSVNDQVRSFTLQTPTLPKELSKTRANGGQCVLEVG